MAFLLRETLLITVVDSRASGDFGRADNMVADTADVKNAVRLGLKLSG
jgi:hypothetical protein